METDEESYSGDSSSSGSSSNSSDGEQERVENVRILGTSLQLPQDLCENPNIFREFLSTNTWNQLDNEQRRHLKVFLPTFPENDDDEKEETVRRLFARENFHFGSPLDTFFEDLQQGNFRPDLAKMKKVLLKARDKQQKHKLRSIYARTMADVLVSRERLLTAAQYGPPGPPPRLPDIPNPQEPITRPPYMRAKLRYFQELAAIGSEVGTEDISEDENFPEGPPSQRKRARRHLSAIQNSIGVSETFKVHSTLGCCEVAAMHAVPTANWITNALSVHRARRLACEKTPELDTTGITLSEIKQRVALINGHKKPSAANIIDVIHNQKTPGRDLQQHRQPSNRGKRGRAIHKKRQVESNRKRPPKNCNNTNGKSTTDNESASDGLEMRNLGFIGKGRVKSECRSEESETCEMEEDSEGNCSYLELESPQMCTERLSVASAEVKQGKDIDKNVLHPHPPPSSRATPSRDRKTSILDDNLRIKTEKSEVLTSASSKILATQPVPLKLEDLDGIDMMDLPVEIESAETTKVQEEDTDLQHLSESSSGLVEATHTSFFALVRELFPAPSHRAVPRALRDRLNAWKSSPISPLNHWYHLVEDWSGVLMSALEFLSGEFRRLPDDFVPYLQYKPQHDVYQWIGAGRDCDATLTSLFQYWLEHRRSPSTSTATPAHSAPPKQHTNRDTQIDRIPTPPARWATSWTVRAATNAELADFRAQERRRFAAPHRAFTYMQHGYRSVVGPLKGVAGAASGAKGAAGGGNSVLAANRPRHVTMLALVRDAVARLPNGEGTRADIATLLRMSQWVACNRECGLAGAVSGALDRLHANSPHPSVRYSSARKLWIYMHRDRSEEELEALYAENVASKKSATKTRCKKPTATSALSQKEVAVEPPAPSDTNVELEVGSDEEIASDVHAFNESDSDVDVDDSGPSPPLLTATPTPIFTSTATAVLTSTTTPILTSTIAPTPTPTTAPKLPITNLFTPITPVVTPPTVSVAVPASVPAAVQQQCIPVSVSVSLQSVQATTPIQVSIPQQSPHAVKVQTTARSLLLRPSAAPLSTTTVQMIPSTLGRDVGARRGGVVRVLSPAAPQPGKSLISPRALLPTLQQTHPGTRSPVSLPRRRVPLVSPATSLPGTGGVTTTSSLPLSQVRVTSAVRNATQTVQLPSGQSVQLSTGRAVQLNSGRAVQLSSGRAVHLSSGQAVQLSSGQTVQLANGQTVQLATSQAPTQSVHSTGNQVSANQIVQLSNQAHAVQLSSGMQTVQLPSGQTLQLSTTPSGQTIQLASGQTVQLSGQSGQTVQLSGQTLQLSGQTVQLSGQSGQTVQLASGQTVQIASAQPTQTVQLPGGQTVQLQSGQTVQLANGQTVQLASGQVGQTVQLASGQTVQLSSGQTVQMAPRGGLVGVRPQRTLTDKPSQPLVAKLLTNAQGQVISVEGMLGSRGSGVGRTVQMGTPVLQLQRRAGPLQHHTSLQMRGGGMVRVVSPSSVGLTRLSGRPVLLTSASKPLQNIIIQGESNNSKVSTVVPNKQQTILLSSVTGTSQASRPQTPTLKFQQVTPRGTLQHIKMSPGVKIQQAGVGAGVSGNTQVVQLSSGQQLKVVGAAGSRHVLARVVRPATAPSTTQTQ